MPERSSLFHAWPDASYHSLSLRIAPSEVWQWVQRHTAQLRAEIMAKAQNAIDAAETARQR
jgi:hypothetical protein